MIGVITSRSRSLYQRPMLGPYCLNQDCAQAENLVAWYPLSGRGPDAYRDYAGDMKHLTLAGTLPVVAGPGSGFGLSNTASTANYLAAPLVVTTEPLTVAAWVYCHDLSVQWILWNMAETPDDRNIFVNQGATGVIGAAAYDGTEAVAVTTTTLAAQTWGHACGVWTSTTLRAAYLNGGGKGTSTTAKTIATPIISRIGLVEVSGPDFFFPMNGAATHLCVWNMAKSDAQVQAMVDPKTRWELYYPLWRKTYVFLGDVPYGMPSRAIFSQAVNRAARY